MSMKRLAAILVLLPLSVHAEAEAEDVKVEQPPQEPVRPPTPVIGDGTRLSLDQDSILHLPVNKTGADRVFEELAELVPGTQRDRYGVTFNGASSAENDYQVDGLSTRDPASGVNDSPLSVEFLEEVSVITNGYLPEYGRAQGGLIRAVTRTGSNEFRGSVFVHWSPGALEGQPELISDEGSVVTSTYQLKNLGDLGATLGGPIVKDRLWFFAGIVPSFSRSTYVSEFKGSPGSGNTHFRDARSLQSLLRLTYRPVENHELSASLFSTPSIQDVSRPLGGPRPGGPGLLLPTEITASMPAASLAYTGAFLDKKVLVEAHTGWFHYVETTQLKPVTVIDVGNGPPGSSREVRASQEPDCFGGTLQALPMDRYQANVKAAYLFNALGTHVLKAGVDAEFLSLTQERLSSGGIFQEEPECEGVIRTSSRSNTVGGFLQDSWTFASRVTLNLGARYDLQALYERSGERVLKLGNQISPRAGVVVDPLADGRVKVFASFARYYGQVPLNWVDRTFSGSSRTPGSIEQLVDPEIRAQSSTEVTAGAGIELLSNTRLGVSYVHRNLERAVEEVSVDGGYSFFLGNPGSGRAESLPKPVRTYDAATLSLSRAFADGWLAQASYTLSRLYGNYSSPFRLETEQLRPDILFDFDQDGLRANEVGLLPMDRTDSLKLFGAKEFQLSQHLSTSVGVVYRGASGTPISFYGAHIDYGENAVLILQRGRGGRTPWINTIDSNIGVNYRLGRDQVVSLTLDVFNLFNFQAATRVDEKFTYEPVYPLEDGRPQDLPGRAVINTGDRLDDRANPIFLTEDQVNPNFRQPVQRQAPRRFRFGIRYTF